MSLGTDLLVNQKTKLIDQLGCCFSLSDLLHRCFGFFGIMNATIHFTLSLIFAIALFVVNVITGRNVVYLPKIRSKTIPTNFPVGRNFLCPLDTRPQRIGLTGYLFILHYRVLSRIIDHKRLSRLDTIMAK